MTTSLATRMVGAAATFATVLALSTTAHASTRVPGTVPAPQKSELVAGYEQAGCQQNGYPVYVEIQGTITVPAATAVTGTPGISEDYYGFGGPVGVGPSATVAGGISVDNSGGQAFYAAYAEWNGQPVTAFSVQPGQRVEVTVEEESASSYLVELFDLSTGQEWFQTNPISNNADRCLVDAFEGDAFPSYDFLTQTTPVAFDNTVVWSGEQGQAAKVSKLVGKPPAFGRLFRYNLVDSIGALMAATSKPLDNNDDFTVTDK